MASRREGILHITNGDTAAELLRSLHEESTILPWRDALHEGPVHAGIDRAQYREDRARFIASSGWSSYDEVLRSLEKRDRVIGDPGRFDEICLWFEPDLYDQLQLVEVCALLSGQARQIPISLVSAPCYLVKQQPDELRQLFNRRLMLEADAIRAGCGIWEAFGACDPSVLQGLRVQLRAASLSEATDGPFPYLASALDRVLEELPWTTDGLSRSERQILRCCASGELEMQTLYPRSHHEQEEWAFCGDTVWWNWLARLTDDERDALIELLNHDGKAVSRPARPNWSLRGRLTPLGSRVLTGEAQRSGGAIPGRWVGGCFAGRARNGEVADSGWRWDPERKAVRQDLTRSR